MSAQEHLSPRQFEAYRIFRVGKQDNPEVLFHGFPQPDTGRRSRNVPLDTPLPAEVKHVYNPGTRSPNSTGFTSGWHVVPSEEEAHGYLGKFKDPTDMRVSRVTVDSLRDKPGGRGVKLAGTMHVSSEDWQRALRDGGA